MILMLNNRDSFVFNLVRYFEELGQDVTVAPSHNVTLNDIAQLGPQAIILSPGPCTPQEAGICLQTVRRFWRHIPILGVCLGHQVIAEAFGWQTKRSRQPTHGQTAPIDHASNGLFDGLPAPLTVGLYHSLIADPPEENGQLNIDAKSPIGEAMAISHPEAPLFGVQFHPESVLSEHGHNLLSNFLSLAGVQRTL